MIIQKIQEKKIMLRDKKIFLKQITNVTLKKNLVKRKKKSNKLVKKRKKQTLLEKMMLKKILTKTIRRKKRKKNNRNIRSKFIIKKKMKARSKK